MLCPANYPPKFIANSIFNVTVGIENIYTFKVEDVNSNFNVSIDGGVPDGGQLVDNGAGFYTFSWTISATPTNDLIFRAVDTIGSAALLTPVVYVCNCFNGGECTAEGVINETSVINMACICTEGEQLYRKFLSNHSWTLQRLMEHHAQRIEMDAQKLNAMMELSVLMCQLLV